MNRRVTAQEFAKAAVIEAATGAELGQYIVATADDVDIAAREAAAAQVAWAETPFDRRAAIVREAARLLKERGEETVGWLTREGGSIAPKAQWEVGMTVEQMIQAASLAGMASGELFPSSVPGRTNLWRRVPVGVVGVIAPWNFPLFLAMRSVAPALALGNSVILKPDPQAAISGGKVIAQAFEDAGLPAGVLRLVQGGPSVGEAIVRHALVNMVSFTGSTAVGRLIGEICGKMLKKVVLELGGNNAIVVLPDADIEGAASSAAWGAFLHQGQICMQAGRILVHREVADALTAALTRRAKALYVGDPVGQVHLGPLINDRQAEKVQATVDRTVAMGAKVATGGSRDGRFFQPTVLTDVRPGTPAFDDEIFGPVAPVTTFDSDDEAVALVNASPYGLAAGVHSASLGRAMNVAQRLRVGMVHINDQPVNCEPHVPFGGMGMSGNGGRFGGPASLHEFTETQWLSWTDKPTQYPF
ncbi:MAG: aldehyde dehydrogenase family protein [Rhizobiaceae bacterium]